MKRIFKSIALCLTIAGAGFTTVSCDSETITQILNEVLGNLVNTGQTYYYSGTASIQCLEGASASQLSEIAKGTAKMQVSLKSGRTGTITIPGFTMNGATMSQITLNDLDMSTDDKQTQTFIIGNSSSFGQNDSFTYKDKTYPASNLYIEKATATSESIYFNMTIWFGEETDAVNIEYSGTAVTE